MACLFIVYPRIRPAALPGDPLLYVERAIRELNAVRLTPYQKANAGPVHKADISQIQFWRVSGVPDFGLQLSKVLLLYPAAQLQDCKPSIGHPVNSQHRWIAQKQRAPEVTDLLTKILSTCSISDEIAPVSPNKCRSK